MDHATVEDTDHWLTTPKDRLMHEQLTKAEKRARAEREQRETPACGTDAAEPKEGKGK